MLFSRIREWLEIPGEYGKNDGEAVIRYLNRKYSGAYYYTAYLEDSQEAHMRNAYMGYEAPPEDLFGVWFSLSFIRDHTTYVRGKFGKRRDACRRTLSRYSLAPVFDAPYVVDSEMSVAKEDKVYLEDGPEKKGGCWDELRRSYEEFKELYDDFYTEKIMFWDTFVPAIVICAAKEDQADYMIDLYDQRKEYLMEVASCYDEGFTQICANVEISDRVEFLKLCGQMVKNLDAQELCIRAMEVQ